MTEILLGEFLSTIAFHLFAYAPFLEHLRVKKRLLPVLLALIEAAHLSAFALLLSLGLPFAVCKLVSIPISMLFFFSMVNMERGKVAFVYAFAMAYALMVCGVAGNLAPRLFPGAPGESSWQYGLLTLAVFALTAPLMLRYVKKTAQMVFETYAPRVWNTVWLLPMLTVLIVMLFTYGKSESLLALFVRILLMLCILLSYSYVIESVRGFQRHVESEERIRRLEDLTAIQASQYAYLLNAMEETRRARHDLRQHLAAIQGCIDSGDMAALSSYVQAYGASLSHETPRTFCKNAAVDAILSYYAEKAEKSGLRMEAEFRMDSRCVIPEPALCVLLGNLLENALEACSRESEPGPIRVRALQTGESMLSLTVDNPCSRRPRWKDGRLLSEKSDGFGSGTESVRIIANQYNGDARFEWRDGVFYASIMLNP